MKAATLVLGVVAFAVIPAAAAKGDLSRIDVCGPNSCAAVTDRGLLDELWSDVAGQTPPPPPSPYYALRLPGGEVSGYFVPSSESLGWMFGGEELAWTRLGRRAVHALRGPARLRPFPTPEVAGVRVAGRRVDDPDGYEALLGPLPRAPIPSARGAVWITIDFRWRARNPWSRRSDVPIQYDFEERVVFRTTDWFRVPEGLAERIEADARLGEPASGSRTGFALVALVAIALLPLTWGVRRAVGSLSGRAAAGRT